MALTFNNSEVIYVSAGLLAVDFTVHAEKLGERLNYFYFSP